MDRVVLDSYETADESILFDVAWTIALDTGCTSFDSYFISMRPGGAGIHHNFLISFQIQHLSEI